MNSYKIGPEYTTPNKLFVGNGLIYKSVGSLLDISVDEVKQMVNASEDIADLAIEGNQKIEMDVKYVLDAFRNIAGITGTGVYWICCVYGRPFKRSRMRLLSC